MNLKIACIWITCFGRNPLNKNNMAKIYFHIEYLNLIQQEKKIGQIINLVKSKSTNESKEW